MAVNSSHADTTSLASDNSIAGKKPIVKKNINVKRSLISIDGKCCEPTNEEIISKHPQITAVQIKDARYREGEYIEDYKAYRDSQTKKAREKYGIYINKDKAYGDTYGKIEAEFGNLDNEAKIYENRVKEIEEPTVVGSVGQQVGRTSPAVSSEHIISAYDKFVNGEKYLSEKSKRRKRRK